MIDAHAHIENVPQPARQWYAAGVVAVVAAGIHPRTFSAQQEAAQRVVQAGVCVGLAVGVHPWSVSLDAGRLMADLDLLQTILENPPAGVVAVGELGLDFARARTPELQAAQRRAMRHQLAVARRVGMPCVLHVVRAHADAQAIVRRDGAPATGLQVHGFMGSAEVAQAWLRQGAYLSVGGAVTRPMSARRRAGIRAIPDHRLLVETDAPDQPVASALRAGRTGSPADLPEVVAAVAAVRDQTADHVSRVTTQNARALFRLDRALAPPT